ncbi:hypothetical protein ABVT39_024079 [Epinephelus coioides]
MQDMILLLVTVSCVLFGSSAGLQYETECYGKNFKLPFRYVPPLFRGQLYFTPNEGSRRLMMENGEAKDPRLKVSTISAKLTDLTEKDAGIFSISYDGDKFQAVIKLKISDCADTEWKAYGDRFSYHIPRLAEFLEFTPLDSEDQPKVLWNRTDPQTNKGGRGQVKGTKWEISYLNFADVGFYNFRGKDNTLLKRIQLTVEAKYRSYETKVNGHLFIESPPGDVPWTLTFTSEGEFQKTLMKAGHVVVDDDWDSTFRGRIQVVRGGIEIDPVKIKDAGTYEFRDPQGRQTKSVDVMVKYDPATIITYVGIAVGVLFAVIVCCCCVKKCCCKKSSSKRAESAPQATATPAVYYHDSNQPGAPVYPVARGPDSSHQPLNVLVSREPTSTSPEPLVAPLGGQETDPALSLGYDCLSSDPEPKFELKLPCALPLSSDSTFCDVYTSDKLNFL